MTFTPPATFNLYDYFVGQRIAEGSADRRALLTDEGSWSYGDVDAAAGRLASLLREAGVQPQERVLLALPDGRDYVAALFGAIRMGAVVVMVNPHLKPEQIRYFFDYTTPRVALIATESRAAFEEASASRERNLDLIDVCSDATRARLRDRSAEFETHPTRPDDPAIFLFSGGTTGNPKAVVQTHRAFANTTELYGKGTLQLTAEDITLSVPKLFFGYATGSNLLFPFAVGATAALFPERCTAETLFARIAAFQPTVLINVPTMVNNLLSDTTPDRDLSSLRLATSAGEALPVELHRRWNERFGVPLLDGLGTAEMWHIFISNTPDDVRPGTLGRPVPGFEVRICDEAGHPVATGEVGTMRVRGDSLALGYWQDDEKTCQAFQDGWYVSGDMIRQDQDGCITYCGRADDMLKVSGKWLSPREVENCLLEHEAIHEAAVIGARTADGLVKPKAYVTLVGDGQGSADLAAALQQWVKDRLEPYKYPRSIVFLSDFPRTHLGKVDRGRLAREAAGS